MIGALILILLLYGFSLPILKAKKKRFPFLRLKLMKNLYWYHMLFAAIYYIFTRSSPSDSVGYYERPLYLHDSWMPLYDTGTRFIDFAAYPFINYLGFSYEMMMVLFAWLGYWGFINFYIFFKENLQYKHYFHGVDLVSLIIFLPNMHYWTASLGKGAIIFWGLGLATYALSRLGKRIFAMIVGLLIVYHVRPHIFLFMCVGIVIGLVLGRQKVPVYQKLLVLGGGLVAMALLYKEVLAFANLDAENLLESFDQFQNHRSVELAKSNSGIDISGYPRILKLLTFWFRPLFFDAPGPIGIIVSFENLLYLILAGKLIHASVLRFLVKGSALVKVCIIVFLATSFALSGTLSNLGIIIRQKSMVMYFLLFIILAFLDYKKSRQPVLVKKAAAEKTPGEMQLT